MMMSSQCLSTDSECVCACVCLPLWCLQNIRNVGAGGLVAEQLLDVASMHSQQLGDS